MKKASLYKVGALCLTFLGAGAFMAFDDAQTDEQKVATAYETLVTTYKMEQDQLCKTQALAAAQAQFAAMNMNTESTGGNTTPPATKPSSGKSSGKGSGSSQPATTTTTTTTTTPVKVDPPKEDPKKPTVSSKGGATKAGDNTNVSTKGGATKAGDNTNVSTKGGATKKK